MADLTIIPRDAPRPATADRGRLGRLFNGGERYLPGQRKEAAGAYLFIGPTILLLALFYFIPLIQTFYYSFTHWNPFSVQRASGAGLSNYRHLVTTAQFLSSLGHTLIYIVFTVPIGMAVGLALALLLNHPFRGRSVYRTLVFIPYIAPIVGSAFVFDFVVSPLGGVADGVLNSLGLPQINFLNQDPWAMISIIAFSVWQIAGFNMVIYLAALGAVPDMYYEAGLIDGANAAQRFRSITWPLIWPSTLFLLMIGVVNSIQMFTQGYILTQGGPLTSTQVIMEWIYQQSFVSLNGGLATAGSVVLFLIGMVLTLIQLRFLGRRYAVNLG
ncbi:MAG TPA: sugar ABC transporter permease [Acidimicrobiales bacterium]|nr:sugar ABC transporter permease [Acidimicrobiales bacterium]